MALRTWTLHLAAILVASPALYSPGFGDEPAEATAGVANAETPSVASHRQVALIRVSEPSQPEGSLSTFCLDADGHILAGVATGSGQVRVYDGDGKLLSSWDTPVRPEAINVDPAGHVYVAGGGQLLKYSADHKLLAQVDSPHAASLKANAASMREQIIDQMKQSTAVYAAQKDAYVKQIELREKQIAELKATPEGEQTESVKQRIAVYERAVEAYRRMVAEYEEQAGRNASGEPSDEQVQQQITAMIQYKLRISSISATEREVFFACGAQEGYGFDVWRTAADLQNGERIVSGLSGCCGQMDVQVNADGVFVAENARFRVCKYDRAGQLVCQWGQREQTGVDGFGSCCNPMNVAFGPRGEVYTAESTTGRIKRYSPSGEFLGLVGSVELVPGCKNVSIAVSRDGSRVYMLDITRGHIVVMARPADA